MILLNLILNLLSNLPDLLRCISLDVDLLNLCMAIVNFLTCLSGDDSCVVEIDIVIIQRFFYTAQYPDDDEFFTTNLESLTY